MLSRSLAFFFQVIWVLHLVRNSWSFQIQGGFIEALDGALQVMFDHPPSKPPVDQPTNPANLVFAHHMVGNTYSYDIGMWMAGKVTPLLLNVQ